MDETIEIALAADGGYFDPLFVAATSMAAYCRTPEVVLSFNILDGGIAAADWDYLVQKVTELHPKSSFNKIPVDQSLFEKFSAWNGNRMAYARLMLPEALKDKDWVLYSDCDFLWLRDIAELWQERDGDYAVVAVGDEGSWRKKERAWFSHNGYKKDGAEYFCSGMCLFNLSIFRERGIGEKANEVLLVHPDVPYVDQTALNVSCVGQIKLIDAKWMRFTHQLTKDHHALPSVVHHAGEVPWKFVRRLQPLSDTMLLWHRFNAEIRGISVWKSLRKYFGPLEIMTHRSFVYLARFCFTRWFVWTLCKLTRHPGVYHYFAIRGLRYDLPCFASGRYQVTGDYGDDFHAGPKAQRDVTAILSREGWRSFAVKRPAFGSGFVGKLLARLVWAVKCRLMRLRLPSDCTLFMQYPSEAWSANLSLRVVTAAAKLQKNIRLVTLIHDLASLRWSEDALENGRLAKDEADLIALADVVIVHNAAMKAALVKRGIPAEKMVELGIFDYLTDCGMKMDRALSKSVVVAGNLNPEKAGYLDGLSSIAEVNWNLYGVQFNPERLKGENVHFCGCYPPDELPGKLDGSFGLVWDGPSVESCTGALGNYLRINNPHKLSLYLASGLPVIIWRGAAEAKIVEDQGVGLLIDSLFEIQKLIDGLSELAYQKMTMRVRELGAKIRRGDFTLNAVERVKG